MLSSAWNSLRGKRSRDDKKDEEVDSKAPNDIALDPLNSTARSSKPASKQRRKSSAASDSKAPSAAVAAAPPSIDSAVTVLGPAPPNYQPHANDSHLIASSLDQPLHAPPSYADSVNAATQYPIASSALHSTGPALSSSAPPLYTAAPVQGRGEEAEVEEEKKAPPQFGFQAPLTGAAGAGAMGLAVPVMQPPPRMSQRLLEQATRGFLALQSHPHFQAGQAKAMSPEQPTPPPPSPPHFPVSLPSPHSYPSFPVCGSALLDKHVPPDLREFIANPTLGKMLRHPTYIFIIYRLYAGIRAPFVGVFKLILLNAARKALGRGGGAKGQAQAERLNDDINSGLKDAIGQDFNVRLSPAVCQQIVQNIDPEDIKRLFGWFTTTQVVKK